MGNEKNLSNDEKKLLLAVKKDDFRGTSDLLATLKKKSKRSEPSDVNFRDKYGKTALHVAASTGSKDMMELLIKNGVNPYVKDNDGFLPVHVACELAHSEIMKFLLDSYPDQITSMTPSRDTLLHLAVSGNRCSDVDLELLVELGVNILAENSKKETAFLKTLRDSGRTDQSCLLLKLADRKVTDKGDFMAMMDLGMQVAPQMGKVSVMQQCLDFGYDVNRVGMEGTAMHGAVKFAQLTTIEFLLEKGARTDVKDRYGFSVDDILWGENASPCDKLNDKIKCTINAFKEQSNDESYQGRKLYPSLTIECGLDPDRHGRTEAVKENSEVSLQKADVGMKGGESTDESDNSGALVEEHQPMSLSVDGDKVEASDHIDDINGLKGFKPGEKTDEQQTKFSAEAEVDTQNNLSEGSKEDSCEKTKQGDNDVNISTLRQSELMENIETADLGDELANAEITCGDQKETPVEEESIETDKGCTVVNSEPSQMKSLDELNNEEEDEEFENEVGAIKIGKSKAPAERLTSVAMGKQVNPDAEGGYGYILLNLRKNKVEVRPLLKSHLYFTTEQVEINTDQTRLSAASTSSSGEEHHQAAFFNFAFEPGQRMQHQGEESGDEPNATKDTDDLNEKENLELPSSGPHGRISTNNSTDWDKDLMNLAGVGEDPTVFAYKFEQDMIDGMVPKTIAEWLLQIRLSHLESTFKENGYDDISFIGLDVLTVESLNYMGIKDQLTVQDIITSKAVKECPRVPRLEDSDPPLNNIYQWLDMLKLTQYEDNFEKAGCNEDLSNIEDSWQLLLKKNKFDISCVGHRLRLLASLNIKDLRTKLKRLKGNETGLTSVEDLDIDQLNCFEDFVACELKDTNELMSDHPDFNRDQLESEINRDVPDVPATPVTSPTTPSFTAELSPLETKIFQVGVELKIQGDKYKEKLDSVLVRNPNFKQLKELLLILRGEKLSTTDVNPLDAAIFRNAPMVSVDIERVFSSMGQIQSLQRMRLTIENLKQHLIFLGVFPFNGIEPSEKTLIAACQATLDKGVKKVPRLQLQVNFCSIRLSDPQLGILEMEHAIPNIQCAALNTDHRTFAYVVAERQAMRVAIAPDAAKNKDGPLIVHGGGSAVQPVKRMCYIFQTIDRDQKQRGGKEVMSSLRAAFQTAFKFVNENQPNSQAVKATGH